MADTVTVMVVSNTHCQNILTFYPVLRWKLDGNRISDGLQSYTENSLTSTLARSNESSKVIY